MSVVGAAALAALIGLTAQGQAQQPAGCRELVREVLEHALERVPEALPDTPTSDVAVAKPAEPTENGEVVKH